jgi:hypothetical protein
MQSSLPDVSLDCNCKKESMNAIDTAKIFGQMAEQKTANARDYIGRTIQDGGQTWTLDSANYAGVLYWRKGKSKKLYVVAGYKVSDLARIF